MAPYWTNPSVLALAGDEDPVDVITRLARETALDAMERGWQGPPFDPFELARMRQVPVLPREELRDARTVPDDETGIRVEYNPNRPRGRLRFSVAHELAHSFFPDVAEAPRYRAGPAARDDDWQMEMLCNIAAAEMLMPVGTFAALASAPLDLPDLMRLRSQYDVSTEALLRRVTTLSDRPVTFFVASRVDGNDVRAPFRVDYTTMSRVGGPAVPQHLLLPEGTVLQHCTAVGYADESYEEWGPDLAQIHVQGVGTPPFPGQTLPRVAGLVRRPDERPAATPRLRYVVGDATEPREAGPWLIAHVVNDRTPNWGGPFARALSRRYDGLQESFKEWVAEASERLALGNAHVAELGEGNAVVTLIAQRDYGPRGRLSYKALRRGLDAVAEVALERGVAVHVPRLGAGQAGGSWDVIAELLDLALVRRGVGVTVYTLPGQHFDRDAQTRLSLGT